jgi:hypothetical protein
MKKQILLLMVAFMASMSVAWGQALPGSTPRPLTCTNDPYNPIAGVPYQYTATLSPAGGIAHWFATTSTTFIDGGAIVATKEAIGGSVVSAATNYMTTTDGAASPNTTTITWTTAGLAAAKVLATEPPKLFVAVDYSAPASGCANNFKVYPIRPVNAFVIDIRNMTSGTTQAPLAYDLVDEQCFDIVQKAVYSPGVDGGILYDFGTQELFYEVIAANFTGSYTPSFRLGGLGAGQTANIDWGYTLGTYDNNLATGVSNGDYTTAANAVTTTETNTSAGVSIYVRVTINNRNFEGTALTPITLAVNAINSANEEDVDNNNCALQTAFHIDDTATQNLKPRPTVNGTIPATAPNPTEFLPNSGVAP